MTCRLIEKLFEIENRADKLMDMRTFMITKEGCKLTSTDITNLKPGRVILLREGVELIKFSTTEEYIY